MNVFKILGIVLIAGVIMTFGSEIGERISLPGAQRLVPTAEARVGRPLTPVSVAGVARRTTRRTIRRSTIYRATLPTGCTTVVIEGATLHQCGGTYYQPYNNQYVVVYVD
ncbi:MAG: hypothetical protein WBR24_05955 [Desulfobacterales bacterium]